MSFTLPELPYDSKALEPYISAHTLSFHHGKHHQAYVTNLNTLLQGTALEGKSLEEVILVSSKDQSMAGIFNNAAQVWNHTFYWNSMKTGGGGEPTNPLKDLIVRDFGSYEAFKEQFKQAALTQFGSGWAWLVSEEGKLKITKTGNADLPMTKGQKALMTCDVWEHAYYLDVQNRRADYVEAFLTHLVNWDFAHSNYSAFNS